MFLSHDSPSKFVNDSGDHENVYGTEFSYTEVYEMNGTLYGDCEKKAVHIRERVDHMPWYNSKNPMVFSNLTSNVTSKISKEELEKAKTSIEYTTAVNSEYG